MIRSSLFIACCFSLACATIFVQAADKKQKRHTLPKDPKAAVIVLEYQGGFTPPRTNNEPALTIQADGTVILGAPFGQRKRIEAKIDQNELQELLRYLLDDQQMAKFDSAKVKDAVRAEQQKKGGLAIAIADASTPYLLVNADGKEYEAKYYALGMMASQYPAVKELARFEAARKRLEQFRSKVAIGGPKVVTKYLAMANEQLKADHPQVPALNDEHLQSAGEFVNGRVYVSFNRQEKLDDGDVRYTSVSINVPANDKPQVRANVSVRPGK